MDSTVIQEIANQLGIAADQAGQFITEHLPAFASLKVVQATIPLIIVWAIFALCVIVALVAIGICERLACKERKRKKQDIEDDKNIYYKSYYIHCSDHECTFFVFKFAAISALVILLIALTITGYLAPQIYGWSNYPEAMLIDMALGAIN